MMPSQTFYYIDLGDLVIRASQDNAILWKGKPNGVNVELALSIPNSEDLIVLLNWLEAAENNKKNLLRFDPHGNVVWEVESAPQKNPPWPDRDVGIYTGVKINGNIVVAFAFPGFSDEIDILTGKIINWEFVK